MTRVAWNTLNAVMQGLHLLSLVMGRMRLLPSAPRRAVMRTSVIAEMPSPDLQIFYFTLRDALNFGQQELGGASFRIGPGP